MKNEKRKVKSGRFAQPEVLSGAEGTNNRIIIASRNNLTMSVAEQCNNKTL